jgi:hypothetical protein
VSFPIEPEVPKPSPRLLKQKELDILETSKQKIINKKIILQMKGLFLSDVYINAMEINRYLKNKVISLMDDEALNDTLLNLDYNEINKNVHECLFKTTIIHIDILNRLIALEKFVKELALEKGKKCSSVDEFLHSCDELLDENDICNFISRLTRREKRSKECHKMLQLCLANDKKVRNKVLKKIETYTNPQIYLKSFSISEIHQEYILQSYIPKLDHRWDEKCIRHFAKGIEKISVNDITRSLVHGGLSENLIYNGEKFSSTGEIIPSLLIKMNPTYETESITDIYTFLEQHNWGEYQNHLQTFLLADDLKIKDIVDYLKQDLFNKDFVVEKLYTVLLELKGSKKNRSSQALDEETQRLKLNKMSFIEDNTILNIKKSSPKPSPRIDNFNYIPSEHSISTSLITELDVLRLLTINAWSYADKYIRELYSSLFIDDFMTKSVGAIGCRLEYKDIDDFSLFLTKSYHVYHEVSLKDSFTPKNKDSPQGKIKFSWKIVKNFAGYHCSISIENIELQPSLEEELIFKILERVLSFKTTGSFLGNRSNSSSFSTLSKGSSLSSSLSSLSLSRGSVRYKN